MDDRNGCLVEKNQFFPLPDRCLKIVRMRVTYQCKFILSEKEQIQQ
jgi:hypothetical protein